MPRAGLLAPLLCLPFLTPSVTACGDEEERQPDSRLRRDLSADGGPDAGKQDAPGEFAADLPDARLPDQGVTSGTFEWSTATRTLRLTLSEPGLLRVRYLVPNALAAPERGWTALPLPAPSGALPAVDTGTELRIETPLLLLRVRKADATLLVEDRHGRTLLAELPLAQPAVYSRLVRAALPVDAHVYGLGEKVGPLDKRGRAFTLWNSDPLATGAYTTDTDPLYQSIPFFIATRPQHPAYGLYLASTFETRFDFGKSKADELTFETTGGELDYYLLAGPTVPLVVRRFASLVGRTPLPPLWALGYHQCKWSYAPESELRKVAAELRARAIPCDGLWLDIDHMDGFRSFTFSPSGFPAPQKLLSELAQDGFKTTVIIDPGIKHDPGGLYTTYDTGVAGGHFVEDAQGQLYVGQVWPGAAVFPDFTRPATRLWWGERIKTLVDVGVQGVWIDMNEPTTWTPGGFPLDSRWDGEGTPTDHREAHNVYALLMAKATREGMAQAAPTRRPFVLTRAGFAGIQRHAAVWTGDQESTWAHLALAPAMLAGLGLSGVVFAGTDVGGYAGNPGPELYARWIQLGALSTFFRTHVQTGQPPQEPWAFGPQVEAIARSAIELRYRRLPYLYALFRQAYVAGDPPLRPLLYEFPDDAVAATSSDQLLLGPFLLAAPVVTQGQTLRRVYLPAGTWTDYHDDRSYRGPGYVDIAAPLAKLPLFVRENGILPAWDVTPYVGQKSHDVLYLDLYPVAGAPRGELELYADDGATPAYEKGAYQAVGTRLETTPLGTTFTLDPATGAYSSTEQRARLVFHGVLAAPTGATRDGQPLPALGSLAALNTQDGWYYDAKDRIGHVSIGFPRFGAKVTLAYDASLPLAHSVAVTLEVALPDATPAVDLYLASSLDAWLPDGRKLTRLSPTAARLVLTMQAGETLRYKYTRGDWATVEKLAGCAERADRELTIVDDGSGQLLQSDSVETWADVCP